MHIACILSLYMCISLYHFDTESPWWARTWLLLQLATVAQIHLQVMKTMMYHQKNPTVRKIVIKLAPVVNLERIMLDGTILPWDIESQHLSTPSGALIKVVT